MGREEEGADFTNRLKDRGVSKCQHYCSLLESRSRVFLLAFNWPPTQAGLPITWVVSLDCF